jgi:hypothetical protein
MMNIVSNSISAITRVQTPFHPADHIENDFPDYDDDLLFLVLAKSIFLALISIIARN